MKTVYVKVTRTVIVQADERGEAIDKAIEKLHLKYLDKETGEFSSILEDFLASSTFDVFIPL